MNRRSLLGTTAMALAGLALLPSNTLGQQHSLKERLLGTWMLVSIDTVRADSHGSPLFGTNPKGIAMFDGGGHYVISVMRSDRPAFAVNDRMQGTAEENRATSQGTVTYFGTYSVSETDRSMLVHIDASSFPNWNGADQKRLVTLTEDQLKLTVPPAPTGGAAIEVMWKRAK
jgi:Lipocalin-like domain